MLLPPGAGWTRVCLEFDPGGVIPTPAGDATAVFRTWHEAGGWVVVDRNAGTAVIGGAAATDPTEVTHPWLAWIAQAYAWWSERPALHAGGVMCGNGAWAVLGPSGWGKTTTLAALHARDWAVLADDVLIIDGRDVLAGPRALDLRPERAVAGLTAAREVRGGERRRMPIGPVPISAPLMGFLHLTWGDRVELRRLSAVEHAALLNGPDAWRSPVFDRRQVLELLALPAFELRRTYDALELDEVVECLEVLEGVSA